MKTVIITGSSSGIGRSIAKRLNDKYNIVINYNRHKKEAMDLLTELRKSNPNVIAIKADVSNELEVNNIFEIAEKNFGNVDILVNNAGISHYSLVQDTKYSDFKKVIETNLNSVFLCSKRAIPNMIKNRYGVIINISSIWSNGASMESAYSASKGAINSFTKSLAKELCYENIRVNAISPGVVNTEMMNRDFNEEEKDYIKSQIPFNRFASPDEVASLLEYLISDDASYITGEIININGGFSQ